MASDLAHLQRELAALILKPGRLAEFRRGRSVFARSRGLKGGAAKQFASLSAAGVAYFASRRRIDRAGYLSASMPRTVTAAQRTGALRSYFDAEPYALEDWRKEARRFARWITQAARHNVRLEPAARIARTESQAIT